MKKITLKSLLIPFFALFFYTSIAQELMYEVSLSQQVQSSTQIIEGKVISKKSFWDNNRSNIYTINTVEVFKVFKGQALSTIEIVTRGGAVGLEAEIVSPSLQLEINDIGIFTLENNNNNLPNNSNARFKPYSEAQGFYKYNTYTNVAVNPFKIKNGIAHFYNEIETLTNRSYTAVNTFDIEQIITTLNTNRNVAAINNFTPTNATAGTKTVLTINGSGFGATKQNVGFANANDGGSTYTLALATQILTWNDTQITVEIPSQAGTGTIAIINSAATAIIFSSAGTLNINYSEINAVSDAVSAGTNVAYPTQHINRNGNGGYIWQMHTDFNNNAAANASFMRAFDTWRCETDIYWEIGAVTAIDVVANDDVNIIRFDNGAELSAGVLGVCTSRFSGCFTNGNTSIDWFVEELDIVFDDTTNWQFGPANANGAQIDFETVAVHELGHGHQLGHVIDSNKIMHYAIGGGTNNRVLNASDIAAGNDVQSRSTTLAPCGTTSMSNFDCSILSVDDMTLENNILIYPNPAQQILNIKNNTYAIIDSAIIYDVRGRLISTTQINDSRVTKSINVSNLQSGLYFVKLNINDTSITKKFVVE